MEMDGIYGELIGILHVLTSDKPISITDELVEHYNSLVNRTNKLFPDENVDRFLIPDSSKKYSSAQDYTGGGGIYYWQHSIVIYKITSFKTYLQHRYRFEETFPSDHTKNDQPSVVILNQNTLAVTINNNIDKLISSAKTDEEKQKLTELDIELKKEHKSWEKIKPIMIWVLNYSKDLSLQIIPIILKSFFPK